VLTLVQEGVDGVVPRPNGWLASGVSHLNARSQTWWKLHASDPSLSCELVYTLSQGQLFQLMVQLPPAWIVESVLSAPQELLASWTAADQQLRLVLTQSLQPGVPSKFSIRLRLPPGGAKADLFDLPELDPLQATVKEGLITVSADAAS